MISDERARGRAELDQAAALYQEKRRLHVALLKAMRRTGAETAGEVIDGVVAELYGGWTPMALRIVNEVAHDLVRRGIISA